MPLDALTVPASFQRTVARFPDRVALQTADGSVSHTWEQLSDLVRRAAAGLSAIGVGHGNTVGVLLPNTVECHVLDYAAAHLGAVPFSIFNSAPAEQIIHQLRTADAEVVVTNMAFRDKVATAVDALDGQVRHLIVIDAEEFGETMTMRRLLESGAEADFDFDSTWRNVHVDDIATLIYTSGTTGPPKAAQWSNRTVMSQQRALDAVLPLPTENVVSFLPMAHAGGRITVHYMALAYGAAITVCPDPRQLMATMAAVHPDAFFSVPRFWEKIQVAIEAMMEAAPDSERILLQRAAQTGLDYTRQLDAGSDPASASTTRQRRCYGPRWPSWAWIASSPPSSAGHHRRPNSPSSSDRSACRCSRHTDSPKVRWTSSTASSISSPEPQANHCPGWNSHSPMTANCWFARS
jgi:long-chain acyl-CoA synthetase